MIAPGRSLCTVLVLGCFTAPLAAQAPESNLYLPINSWTTPYVEHLIRSGVLQGLDPLTRPLRRADVARAVAKVDTTGLAESVRNTLRLLAWELQERPDTVRWKVEANAAALGASDPGRWSVRPAQPGDGLFWHVEVTGSLEFPHFAVFTSPYVDTRLVRDTQFYGRATPISIHADNAETGVLATWKYLDVFVGNEPRNWGPPDVEGLLLSPSPYPYDYLMLRVGPPRFRLEMIATQLNDMPFGGTGPPARRFVSLHRLLISPSDRVSISLSEGALYADTLGQSRSFEPWYLSPANLWLLINNNGIGNYTKTFLALDATYLAPAGLRLAGQLFVNDIKVDRRTPTNPEKPEELGYTVSLTGAALQRLASWSAFYTRVDNLVYMTEKGPQFHYSVRGVGLGRDHIDYDQVTGRTSVLAAPRTLVGAEITYIRQGVGDFRNPFPPIPSLADSLRFLTGIVERALRVAAQVNWSPVAGVNLSTDVGRHFIWNANHVRGVRDDRWVWRLRAEIGHRFTGGIHWSDWSTGSGASPLRE